MHEENIYSIRAEAERLANLEIFILKEMRNAPGLVVKGDAKDAQTYNTESILDTISMLSSEASNLRTLNMVLAVVGTMKAGKSTTINAIVGTEVLPSRNEPMTALPTFIRHTKGQLEPRLLFQKNEPLQSFANLARKKIQNILHDNNGTAVADRGLKNLIEALSKNCVIATDYNGADSIFEFLTIINDLVRFSREFDLEFPFDAYSDIKDLPLIEVEFSHLSGNQGDQGTLTLLDTPGPNEAGQPHLAKMLRNQLQGASAVLAVMDYTQLKSEADVQIQQELNRIAEIVDDRLFVMVNKFDQRGHHDMTEEQACSYVRSNLLYGNLAANSVFPVSSRRAYLANYALRSLKSIGTLPNANEKSWVTDFCKNAVDPMWEPNDALDEDTSELSTRASKLWIKSGFKSPIENIIKQAHSRSALLVLDSATSKLIDVAKRIHNQVEVRENGLRVTAEKLHQVISSIRDDISRTTLAQEKAREISSELFVRIRNFTERTFKEAEARSIKELDQYFENGYPPKPHWNKKSTQHNQLARPQIVPTKHTSNFREADFDPRNVTLEFSSKADADAAIKKICNSLKAISDHAEATTREAINTELTAFQKNFNEVATKDVQEILGGLAKRMRDSDFKLILELPTGELNLNFDAAALFDSVQSRSANRTYTINRDDAGVFAAFLRYADESFGETRNWGRTKEEETKTIHQIHLEDVKKSLQERFRASTAIYSVQISAEIENRLTEKKEKFFSELQRMMESIRSDLLQSQRDHSKDERTQRDLIAALGRIKKDASSCLDDCESLQTDVLKLKSEES